MRAVPSPGVVTDGMVRPVPVSLARTAIVTGVSSVVVAVSAVASGAGVGASASTNLVLTMSSESHSCPPTLSVPVNPIHAVRSAFIHLVGN